jgi:ribose 5-phosphate isomerase B
VQVAIGADHGGFRLKEELKQLLSEMNIPYRDFGTYSLDSVDYPDIAETLARSVANGEYDRGILLCGTGIGMSIAANKIKGIRAALVHDVFSAEATREHNDSNILCMGERVIGFGLSRLIARTWLKTAFAAGRHVQRVNKIAQLEGC